MKPIIKIHRYWQDTNQTFGTCVVLGDDSQPLFTSLSLERGWQGNQNNISCIPIGLYTVKLEYSNRFQTKLWEIKDVPNRSECKFHAANYWHQLNGCVALGLAAKKINNDKYFDVSYSGNTMKVFHSTLGNYQEAILIISGEPTIK